MEFINQTFKDSAELLQKTLGNQKILDAISLAITELANRIKEQRKVYSCGNGGSLCDAMHFSEELTGRFRGDREPIPAMAICEPAYLTCVANDYDSDEVFARFIKGWGRTDDVLLVISTSGNSKNIIKACKVARENNMYIIGLLGKGGGVVKDLVDNPIIIESSCTERIQEMHIKLIHIFIEGIERILFPNNYQS